MHISTRHPDATLVLEAQAESLASDLAARLFQPALGRRSIDAETDRMARLLAQARTAASLRRRALGRGPHRKGSMEEAEAHRLKDLHRRFAIWRAIIDALRQIERRATFPLLPRPRDVLDPRAGIDAIADIMFTRAHRAVNPVPQAAGSAAHGCFADIPTRVSLFLEIAHLAYRLLLARCHDGPMRFLDVGCGGGIKVALASGLFEIADGIEFDPGYAETARRTLPLMRAQGSRIFECDALGFDKYAQYDVIYLYRPMRDDDLLRQLEGHILAQVRPGTIILAPYQTIEAHGDRLRRIAESVYAAGISAKEADLLARRARRIGPHIVHPRREIPNQTGWLAPLWKACEANGFDPAAWE